jgi:hypothetical protein
MCYYSITITSYVLFGSFRTNFNFILHILSSIMRGSVRAGDGCMALPGRWTERDNFPICPETDRERVGSRAGTKSEGTGIACWISCQFVILRGGGSRFPLNCRGKGSSGNRAFALKPGGDDRFCGGSRTPSKIPVS